MVQMIEFNIKDVMVFDMIKEHQEKLLKKVHDTI